MSADTGCVRSSGSSQPSVYGVHRSCRQQPLDQLGVQRIRETLSFHLRHPHSHFIETGTDSYRLAASTHARAEKLTQPGLTAAGFTRRPSGRRAVTVVVWQAILTVESSAADA
ncbi:hypothetical protein ACFU5Y_15835 [Streptomyces gardneri]|uniref:hypothetical protein n=1 Tax=Streptomyces gardneri TaxID=66892 RepID=UPI0036BEAB19